MSQENLEGRRLPPESRAWAETERMRGAQLVRAIVRQRELPGDTHGLGRFRTRMALVELTGTVASWAGGVHDRLITTRNSEAAAVFGEAPPFADAEPAAGEYDQLLDFVQARMRVLEELLGAGTNDG